ncbi:MAG: squalene/phytoene synthase family protein [Alphaproteobacteria bacterium]|jgi:phytoene/squalene synthetase
MVQPHDTFLAALDPLTASVVAAGIDRAARRPNNMARVAAALSLPQQALFHVTYALMRVIDDFVDEDFMARTADEREIGRAAAFAVVDRWQTQSEAAAAGRFTADAGSLHADLFTVMNRVVGNSDIGAGPWRALAGAMRADLAEGRFETWQDFDAYAEGAAVAPASIFIYILAAAIDDDLASQASLDRPPADYARGLALFCYLVHILRDLSDDAGRAERLVTLPNDTLSQCGIDKPMLARAVAGDRGIDLCPLVDAVGSRAGVHRAAAETAIAGLRPQIGTREGLVLDTLFALYDAQYRVILANPEGVADGSVALDDDAIAPLLARLRDAA